MIFINTLNIMKSNYISQKLFNVYLFLLIFNIINRAFYPLGFDLRIAIFSLGFVLLIIALIGKVSFKLNTNIVLVCCLYLIIIIGIFHHTVNNADENVYKNVVILNLYSFFNIIILNWFSFNLNPKLIKKYFNISWYFLFMSVLVSSTGLNLPFNNVGGSASAINAIGNENGIRFCGYGSDPNYVCVFALCYIIFNHSLDESNKEKTIAYFSSIIAIILSRSRTAIVIAIILYLVSVIAEHSANNIKKIIFTIIFVLLAAMPLIMLNGKYFGNNISMKLRYDLWEQAFLAFTQHPILGNGLMSDRNITFYYINWFVQCHSTYFQLLCDHGIFALILYFFIYYNDVMKNIDNPLKYCFLLYFAWSFTYETMYLTYTILFFGLLPYCSLKLKEEK